MTYAIVIRADLDERLDIETIGGEYDRNGGEKRLFITASINIRIVTSPPLAFHPLYRADNYGSLQEIINSGASLSPNEATRIGPSADGDVVRLIAALPSCVRRSSRCCPGISELRLRPAALTLPCELEESSDFEATCIYYKQTKRKMYGP